MVRRNKSLCVKVAKDVLEQLRLERYQAEHTYVALRYDGHALHNYDGALIREVKTKVRKSFKDFFKEDEKITCNVCALGSAFMSLVNIENKCTVRKIVNGQIDFDRLKEVFGARNMTLMECAFESTTDYDHGDAEDFEKYAATLFGWKYNDDRMRLEAIMRNIIKNKGDFKLFKSHIAQAKRELKQEAYEGSSEGSF